MKGRADETLEAGDDVFDVALDGEGQVTYQAETFREAVDSFTEWERRRGADQAASAASSPARSS